ncbi:unnamed protein product [Ascophyllum nodosum]
MFAHVISQVPEGAFVDLLCEECERRHAVAKCEECNEVLCPLCLAILHIPSAGGQAHPDLAQEAIRNLREGDESSVKREKDCPISAHQVDEDEMATRRDLAVPSDFDAPSIDLTSRCAPRNASSPLHTKGQIVVFDATLADFMPHSLCEDGICDRNCTYGSSRSLPASHELYGEVMSVPLVRHGKWGHAGRRAQGHRLLLRVRVLGYASGSYSEPFVEEWFRRKRREEAPRKRVKIAGGDGTDLLAIASRMARAKDSQREALKKTLAPAENELPMLPRPSSDSGLHVELGQRLDNLSCVALAVAKPLVVLLSEHQLFTVEEKREQLWRKRCDLLEACRKNTEGRQKVVSMHVALERWRKVAVEIGSEERKRASTVIQRRTRGTLVRLWTERQRTEKEKERWEAGRRLHRQFRYLNTEKFRKKAGGGVTTDGRVFLESKTQVFRLEALRRVMALRVYRTLCKGVLRAKVRAFKHLRCHMENERCINKPYIFSVANDVSLAADQLETQGPRMTKWRYRPSHEIALPPLLPLHFDRLDSIGERSKAATKVTRKMAGPTPFCSWLIPGLVLISSYLDTESKARPRDFKQPLYPDASAQIMLAGVGTLVALSSREEVRKHESDEKIPAFDEAFERRHSQMSTVIETTMREATYNVAILQQEENNLERLRHVEDYDQEKRRKKLADVVNQMRIARSTLTRARQMADVFPKDVNVAWEGLPQGYAPRVADVIDLVVRLEDRLKTGEKICLWSPRGHGRVGMVGAVLLGRLYGCSAEEALLRVQVCHDARESLKGQPRISCPQTTVQVHCVREALISTSTFYTLTMRADPPVSTRGTKVCKRILGQGQTSRWESVRVPDETQEGRYNREREHRRQIENLLNDHQPALLMPPGSTNVEPVATLSDYQFSSKASRTWKNRACFADRTGDGGMRNRRGDIYRLGLGIPDTVGDEPTSSKLEMGCYPPENLQGPRITPVAPYPTLRSLRLKR